MLFSRDREGLEEFRIVGNPIKLPRSPAVTTLPPPTLGEGCGLLKGHGNSL